MSRNIEENGFNLNISRYVSTAIDEEIVDINVVSQELYHIEEDVKTAKEKHNTYLEELGFPKLPWYMKA